MSQFSSTGYKAKTQNEYYKEDFDGHKAIDPNWNLEPSTPDGLMVAVRSEDMANLDENIEHVYNSKNPKAATGYDLDIICMLGGITRDEGSESTVTLTMTGNNGTLIPRGSKFDSGDDTPQFETIADATIPISRTIDIEALCTEKGAIEADPNSITRAIQFISGFESCTNIVPATAGRAIETDEELERRRFLSVARRGRSTMDSMESDIYSIPGVKKVITFENNTKQEKVVKGATVPANSYGIIVDGGDDDEICKAIFRQRSVGIPQVFIGDGEKVEQTVTDDENPQNPVDVRFTRPKFVDIDTVMTIKRDSTLPGEATNIISDYIVKFANGEQIDGDEYKPGGYQIGESLAVSQLYTPIMLAISQFGASYIINLSANEKTSAESVAIRFDEKVRFSKENIAVTYDDT